MSTTLVNEAAAPPTPSPPPVHPPIPLNLGSYVSLTGIAGAAATFVIAWGENNWHMTSPIAALGLGAVAAIIGWYHGRSQQAAALIDKARVVLKDVGIEITPPKG